MFDCNILVVSARVRLTYVRKSLSGVSNIFSNSLLPLPTTTPTLYNVFSWYSWMLAVLGDWIFAKVDLKFGFTNKTNGGGIDFECMCVLKKCGGGSVYCLVMVCWFFGFSSSCFGRWEEVVCWLRDGFNWIVCWEWWLWLIFDGCDDDYCCV